MKDKILDLVFDFFVASSDFNGIPLRRIPEELAIEYKVSIDLIKELVKEDKVSIQSSTNPHIIGFQHFLSDDQLEILEEAKNIKVETVEFGGISYEREDTEYPICIYPSRYYLKSKRDLSKFGNSIYTKELALGEPSLSPLFFEIEVLERYANDPRFEFKFENYSGSIYCKYDENDQPIAREEDNIFLKSFGLGFDLEDRRVVAVYRRYLKGLTAEHQVYWNGKEAKGECKMIKEYHDNTILGVWTNSYSIFSAFLGEQSCLNELSLNIFGKPLFRKIFDDKERPREFTFFFTPTLRNYNEFIHLLDKMISENLNKEFFEDKIDLFDIINLEDGIIERRTKGTLRLFEDWFLSHYNPEQQKDLKDVFKPFKKVRKLRQKPAHRINENVYDPNFFNEQKTIMSDVYYAMRAFRKMFQQHPGASNFETPKWLDEGDVINF